MKLILFGPPGSGKSSYADLIEDQFGYKHISTGELLRDAVASDSEVGKKAKEYMESGRLVPDDIINIIVDELLPKDNFILDGYPRTLPQAEFLDMITNIDLVFYFDVPEEVIFTRLLKRKRKDDTRETIEFRLREYEALTVPLLDYYEDKLIEVDASKTIKEVAGDVAEEIKKGPFRDNLISFANKILEE